MLKEEIDLLEVPLHEVISAYLEDMESAGVVDYWDEMTEFLLLMSLLVEVKSRLLLPGAYPEIEDELTPEEARDQLLARLFEYSKFKAASLRLRGMGEQAGCSVLRAPAGVARRRLPAAEEIVGTGDPMDLRDCLVRLVDSKREPDTAHIAQIKVELQRQIRIIRGILAKRGRFSFNRVFAGEPPLVQALSVFGLLELLARGEVRVSQAELFGDIVVRARENRKTA
ncbi:MAG: segregation/condensation protein A [Thermoleophilia bacterium]|nr:segregation/condensation protein A [Thermoleophilia bacterium]